MTETRVTTFGYLQEFITGYALEPVSDEVLNELRDSALDRGHTLCMRSGVLIEDAQKQFQNQQENCKIFTADETLFLTEAAQLLTVSRNGNKLVWTKLVGFALAYEFPCGFDAWSSGKVLIELIYHLEDGGYFQDGYKTIHEFFQNV